MLIVPGNKDLVLHTCNCATYHASGRLVPGERRRHGHAGRGGRGGSTDLPGLRAVETRSRQRHLGPWQLDLALPGGSLSRPPAPPLLACSMFSFLPGVGFTLWLPSCAGIQYLWGRLKLGLTGFMCDPPGFSFRATCSRVVYSLVQPAPACPPVQGADRLLPCFPSSGETNSKQIWKSADGAASGSDRLKKTGGLV